MVRLLAIFLGGFCTIYGFSQDGDSVSRTRPNILLIISNGHGAADLGCGGKTCIKTPFLDQLATEGIRMENAYNSSACNSAIYTVILTGFVNHASGQYGKADGISHFSVFPEIKSLTYYLKRAGYRSAHIGIFPLAADSNFIFDSFLGQDVNPRNSSEMANRCSGFISEKDSTPFFLLFCTADPDRSYEFFDDIKFGADQFGNREEGYEGMIPKFYNPSKMDLPGYLQDKPEAREEFAQYAQAVSRLDLGIGRLIYQLHLSGQWDQTLIIYLSSNGPCFPGVQNDFNDANMHVPLIIKPPFYHEINKTCNAMVSLADITPTILTIAGIINSDQVFQGRSFSNVMFEEDPLGWDEVYFSNTFDEITMYYPMRVIQTRQFKLIRNITWQLNFPFSYKMQTSATWQGILKNGDSTLMRKSFKFFFHRPEIELFDLLKDPFELINLASDPSYHKVLLDLKSKLNSFQRQTNDPWILRPMNQ